MLDKNISLFFNEVKFEIKKYFKENSDKILSSSLDEKRKEDNSIVTESDLAISTIIEDKRNKYLSNVCFYSEENFDELNYPALIIDPIDGTIEFSNAIGECCVSIAYVQNNKINCEDNHAWLYNPFTGFEIESSDFFIKGERNFFENDFSCQVSRTEWNKGIYRNLKLSKTKIMPRGSIAFKLANLAAGSCDFVYSYNPKNIWDIAAGSIICAQRNIFMYRDGIKIEKFESSRIDGKIFWIQEKLVNELKDDIEDMKRL